MCRLPSCEELEYPLGTAHAALDVEGPYVLPVLLQKGYKEVHPEVDIGSQVISCHVNMTDSNSED